MGRKVIAGYKFKILLNKRSSSVRIALFFCIWSDLLNAKEPGKYVRQETLWDKQKDAVRYE